jgi:hypothetical protein
MTTSWTAGIRFPVGTGISLAAMKIIAALRTQPLIQGIISSMVKRQDVNLATPTQCRCL